MTADTTASPSGAEPRAFVLLKSRRRLDLLNPTRTPAPMMTSRPASRPLSDGAGRHDENIRCPSSNTA
jgi:hypothetical protein